MAGFMDAEQAIALWNTGDFNRQRSGNRDQVIRACRDDMNLYEALKKEVVKKNFPQEELDTITELLRNSGEIV